MNMNFVIITFTLLLFLSTLIEAGQKITLEEALEKHQSPDGCLCISSKFGCHNINGPKRMVQTGLCNKRCCKRRIGAEVSQCKCMNRKTCPADMPEERGDCPNLVECCPEMAKSEL